MERRILLLKFPFKSLSADVTRFRNYELGHVLCSSAIKPTADYQLFRIQRYLTHSNFKPMAVRPTTTCALLSSVRRCSSSSTQRPPTSSSNTPPGGETPPSGVPPDASHINNTATQSQENSDSEVRVGVKHGLPHLTVPLPSRRELCRFTLRPITHTVRDLVDQLQHEDRGIDRVVVTTIDGVRIASSASIESLLMEDFILIINDLSYRVIVPHSQRITLEEIDDMDDVRQLVNKLYASLNIDQHQLLKERSIISQIEDVKAQLGPLEQKRLTLVSGAQRRTAVLSWAGLGYMAVQFGFLARLTWWEYSWDIMEPVTYFVTYGTAIAAYAYYVVTRQDFILPDVRDRQFLLSFYRRAQKVHLDVNHYNRLKNSLSQLEGDLERLRDPLALNMPPRKLEDDPAVYDALTKAHISFKNLFGFKSSK